MHVDSRDDGFDCHGIDHLLKVVLPPVDLVVLLDMENLAPLGFAINFWIEDFKPFDAPTFEVLDPGGKTHFGLGENEREETMLASPFCGSKMARKCRELVGEVPNVVEGGLLQYCVEWECFHLSPDHFGDGGQC